MVNAMEETADGKRLAVQDLDSASTWHIPSIFHILNLRVVDGFDAMCIVGSDFDVGGPHRQTVGTIIDDQQCVQIQS
jgi:hypothetical protein